MKNILLVFLSFFSCLFLPGNAALSQVDRFAVISNIQIVASSANYTWTSMPLAETILTGSSRNITVFDLSNYREARLIARVSTQGEAAAKLYAKYATTDQTAIGSFSDLAASGSVEVSIAATGTIVGSWTPITEAAKTNAWIAIAGSGGNGSTSPVFGNIVLQVR